MALAEVETGAIESFPSIFLAIHHLSYFQSSLLLVQKILTSYTHENNVRKRMLILGSSPGYVSENPVT